MVVGRRVSRSVGGGPGVVMGVLFGGHGVVVVLGRLVGVFVARRGGVAHRGGTLVLCAAPVCLAGGAMVGGIDGVRDAEGPVGDGIVVWLVFWRSGGVRCG